MAKAKPLPRFDLADLRLYVGIVEHGSLSKAALALPLALSAASARLKTLERRLGVTLLERSAHGMKTTAAGQLFYDHALRLLQVAQDAQEGMDALSGKGRITLRLLCNTTGLSSDLPARLGAFLLAQPNVDIQFEQRSSREVVRAVSLGAADVGIVDAFYDKEDLLYLLYEQSELVVITHREHHLAQRDQCKFLACLEEPLVGLPAESSLQQFIERMAVLAQQPLRFRVNAPSFNAVAQLVAQQVGIALMPSQAAHRYAASLPLRVIALDESWAIRQLNVCVRPQTNTRMPALMLARFLAGLE